MALCILGKRGIFCGETNTSELTEEQAERIIEIAEEMLHEYNPKIVWLPDTSEIGIESENHFLEIVWEEFDSDDIVDEMRGSWHRGYEQRCNDE